MTLPADKPGTAPASDYDTFVNWDARLARELPFFERLFAETGVHHLIDVGAGSARHAIAFAEQGLIVDAVDPDESMLAQAQANVSDAAQRIAQAGGELRLVRGGFGELSALGLGDADALTCTGNALPHAGGLSGLRQALADFQAVLRPGGVLVLHLLNHARLLATRQRSIQPIVREVAQGTRVFLRVIDYPANADHIDLDFVTLTRDHDGAWSLASRCSPHTAMPFDVLSCELETAGFDRIEAFGAHDFRPFDADADESVIVVARRR